MKIDKIASVKLTLLKWHFVNLLRMKKMQAVQGGGEDV